MKLFYDLFKRSLTRLIILLLVATGMVLIEAKSQSDKFVQQEEARINKELNKAEKFTNKKIAERKKKTEKKNNLADQISQKTTAINAINKRLKQSREARLGSKNKLNPVEFTQKLEQLARRNIERAELSIDYSTTMFQIVDINKKIADKTLQKTRLNGELIVIQSNSFLDVILKQKSPFDLLTPANQYILLALFYALFFGALTLKAVNFFLIAPIARKAAPITITPVKGNESSQIEYGAPQKAFDVKLATDNSLVVKPGWFNTNTAGTTKTRLFWEPKKPLASYAVGLVNMTEFVPDDSGYQEVKLASEDDPNRDIMPIQLNNHPGYIIKHGHVVATCGDLHIKKVWGLWSWKNWLFGSLRYVFLTGTGTVYIYGYGCVSATEVDNPDCRIKERHLIGYDTRTGFRMTRSETFINYWLNDTPLYDIQFPDKGRFLQQQSCGQSGEKIFRSVLEDILGAVGKLLGF